MNEEKHNMLTTYTNRLLEMNEYAEDIYLNHTREEGYEVDFFGIVKPFAEEVKVVSEAWLPLAEQLVQEVKPKDLHLNQLTQTVDNFEVVAIKSFYPETSRKKQIETFKAVTYVLEQLKEVVEK
ncbi:YppE family protein [Alkalicoccobacillus murimartini]|uniref:DUF1798 family protein n=1 Tax=Alkalicoccobacillus murimartini TaxID=171685 RepID=A0ABT9YDP7_9BACI|nr:YppE family protein [Alkalicoccobacillus murimartini]MDQ0205969.1 hypothetical protein [Alkalicoccobacillus murimartini]